MKGVLFRLSQISCTFQFHDAYSVVVMAPEVFCLHMLIEDHWLLFQGLVEPQLALEEGMMRCFCILGWHLYSAGMWDCDNQPCRLTHADMQTPCCLQSFGSHRSAFVSGLWALESCRHPGLRQQHHPESLQLSLQLAPSLQNLLAPHLR